MFVPAARGLAATHEAELAQEAKTLYETLAPGHADERREVDAWLGEATVD